jgi:hypothetical protein
MAHYCTGNPCPICYPQTPYLQYYPVFTSAGCICPPTSEKTCESVTCPRKNYLSATAPFTPLGINEMTDEEYRQKLIRHGVRPELLLDLSGHDLDCVGNIVDVYRTSMQQQNPARFEIMQYQATRLKPLNGV